MVCVLEDSVTIAALQTCGARGWETKMQYRQFEQTVCMEESPIRDTTMSSLLIRIGWGILMPEYTESSTIPWTDAGSAHAAS